MSEDVDDYSDEQLLTLLARALDDADPVPHDVRELAKAAPALADLDAELAALVHDSAHGLVGVRSAGTGTGRVLNFESSDLDVVVVLNQLESTPVLDGQVVPAQVLEIELLQQTTVIRTATTDELGRFHLAELPTGPLRLRIRAVSVLTAEFEL